MICSISIVRYPKWVFGAGIISMALFRIPLWMNSKITFWKLMGTGKQGGFDKNPDWQQWALLIVQKEINPNSFESFFLKSDATIQNKLYGKFIQRWWMFWRCNVCTFILQPIEGHGTWDQKEVFGKLPRNSSYEGEIAILTRATIRIKKLNAFWSNVPLVANTLTLNPGLKCSFGIGEVPFIKQATFSIWDSKNAVQQFAYKKNEHLRVIHKTKKEDWYKEEMFVRFIPLKTIGSFK